MQLPRPRFSNCLFVAVLLLWRGRVAKLWLVKGGMPGVPHLIAQTRRGHLLDFKTTLRGDRWRPFWFEGRLRGVRRSRAAAGLAGKVLLRLR